MQEVIDIAPAREVYDQIFEVSPDGAAVFGMGNIGGVGKDLMDLLESLRGTG